MDAHSAVTPVGRPVGVPIPVAPVVRCVIAGSAPLTHTTGEEPAPAVFVGVTVIVPVADTVPQPPVKGIL